MKISPKVFQDYERQQDKPWFDKEVQNLSIKGNGLICNGYGQRI